MHKMHICVLGIGNELGNAVVTKRFPIYVLPRAKTTRDHMENILCASNFLKEKAHMMTQPLCCLLCCVIGVALRALWLKASDTKMETYFWSGTNLSKGKCSEGLMTCDNSKYAYI